MAVADDTLSQSLTNSIHQIKASAGSGKTHTLINILLALLVSDKKSIKDIFSSVLAITFTNAAAADMKSKLIQRLKAIALGYEKSDVSKSGAKKAIDGLIANYNSLNMRTIDSFLLMLLRQNILDSHLPASFDIEFNQKDFFNPLLDDLAQSSLYQGADKKSEEKQILLPLYEDMYDSLFSINPQKGFLGLRKIREKIFETYNLLKDLTAEEQNNLSNSQEIYARYTLSHEKFSEAFDSLDEFIESKKSVDSKGKEKTIVLAKYNEARREFSENKKLNSVFRAEDVESVLQKIIKKKELADLDLHENRKDYQKLYLCVEKLCLLYKDVWLLHHALKYVALINFCKLMLGLQKYEEQSKEVLLSDRISELLVNLIDDEGLLPTMLSRLPYELDFLLVDEFQDTNTKQWQVIREFADDALSRGGSFTYVGDVKQAIYSWRGGNSSLFESVLTDINAKVERTQLDTNWRSCKNVIDFNNLVFSQLKDKDFAQEILQKLCKDHDEIEIITEELVYNFDDVRQNLSPKYKEEYAGKVCLYKIENAQKNEILFEDLRARTLSIINKGLERYDYKDMAILVRDNTMCTNFASWLTAANIPVITEGALQIKSNFIISQSLSFLEFLKDTNNEISLWHLVAFEGLFTDDEGTNLIKPEVWLDFKSHKKTLLECVKEFSPHIYNHLEYFLANRNKQTVYILLCQLFERTNLFDRFPEQSGFFARFLELAFKAGQESVDTLQSFLNYWEEEGHEEKIPMPEGVNAVRILTIHKSKGAEYKFTLVWDEKKERQLDTLKYYEMDKFSFFAPHSVYHSDYANDMKVLAFETFNLLYVAYTRAKEELHVLYKDVKSNPTFIQQLIEIAKEQSEFSEQEKAYVFASDNKKKITKMGRVDNKKINKINVLSYRKPLLNLRELSKSPLEGLSPTERGNLIHTALERYFKLASIDINCDDKITNNIIAEQGLSAIDREKLTRELQDIFGWIKSLSSFNDWIKNSMSEQNMLDESSNLLRCDLCVCMPNKVFVIDFKTGSERKEYAMQLERYINVLKNISIYKDKTIEGVILYLDQQKSKKVEGK